MQYLTLAFVAAVAILIGLNVYKRFKRPKKKINPFRIAKRADIERMLRDEENELGLKKPKRKKKSRNKRRK